MDSNQGCYPLETHRNKITIMNKLINLIGAIVLFGILIKLSYVFVYLFGELDNDSLISKITGITFAFASVYFVVKVRRNGLKITLVALDVATILYFYLHAKFSIDIAYSSVIVSAYSGLIVYYLGRTVSEMLETGNVSESDRLRNELNRLRTETERKEIETEMNRIHRRIADCRNEATKKRHQERLQKLQERYNELKNDC